MEDIKTVLSEMGTAFDEFKKSYDLKLENIGLILFHIKKLLI